MTPGLLVAAVGPLATIQDAGRRGLQRFGVSGSGPMDPIAHAVANRLAGNAEGAAAVEFALKGPTMRVEAEAVRLAFAGGEFELFVDGTRVPWWSAITLRRGETVEVGRARRGVWGYLAVGGGLALPPQLGSLATHTLSRLGGIEGRPLGPDDRLPLARPERPREPDVRLLEPPALARERVRVILGPQDDHFTPAGIETFLGSPWRVSSQADRMGYRLEGPAVEHSRGANIVSDGTLAGSVQVPGAGRPIVLMADRQTTGGYPKIATVITADLPGLAQIPPGGVVRFATVSFEAALAARRAIRRWLDRLPERLVPLGLGDGLDPTRLLSVNLISGVTAGDPEAEQRP